MEFALPDLAGFAAAALLILLACAIALLGALIANTFGRLPVVGSWVTQNIVQSLTDAATSVTSASEATWNFATGFLNWLFDVFLKPYIYAVQFAATAFRWLQVLFTQTIPDAEARALTYAASLATAAEGDARVLFTAAERYASSAAADVLANAVADVRAGEQYAAGLVSSAEHALTAAILTAEQTAASEVSSTARALVSGIETVAGAASTDLQNLADTVTGIDGRLARDIVAEGQAVAATAAANLAGAVGGIYTDLDTWGVRAVADAWPDATGDLAALRRTLGADFPWLNDLLPALAGAGAAGLLGALIRSIAAANVVTNLADDCIIPNCRNLSGLGNDLAGLASLFAEGAFWAWIAYAYADPAGWEADTQAVLVPVTNATLSAARSLFGVS